MALQGHCKECGKPIAFLRLQKNDGTVGKNNPIELAPHRKGNLVISLEKGRYRFASKDEIATAKNSNKNLYVSHFAYCEFAKTFKKEK